MKKTNKFTYLLLVVIIVIIIILSYLLATKNTTIQRQIEEIEKMEATTDNAYLLNSAHEDEQIKVWNKTYAYNDYTWEGATLSTTSYPGLNNSSITINLEESEIIDVSRIQAWTIRLWACDDKDSTNIEDANGYKFRKSSGDDAYWYEYPILHADYNPDLKLITGVYNFTNEGEGKIRKHFLNDLELHGESTQSEYEITESNLVANSYWTRPTSTSGGDYINFTYSSLDGTMKIDFVKDTYSPYAVRGYIVADITIYYK